MIVATYDREADIAWLRFDGYDGRTARIEELEWGLRDVDPRTGNVVALEFWQASERLPSELLEHLPAPSPTPLRERPAQDETRAVRSGT